MAFGGSKITCTGSYQDAFVCNASGGTDGVPCTLYEVRASGGDVSVRVTFTNTGSEVANGATGSPTNIEATLPEFVVADGFAFPFGADPDRKGGKIAKVEVKLLTGVTVYAYSNIVLR